MWFGTWREDVKRINNNLNDLKQENNNNFKEIKKTLDNNSKTITIPLSEYEEMKEKIDYYKSQTHCLDYELNNMVNNYLKFAKENGATPEIEEYTRIGDDFVTEEIFEEIYVPAFRIIRFKGYKESDKK